MFFRFKSNNTYKGPYLKIYDGTGNLYLGTHYPSSTSTYDDKDVIKIYNENGRIDFFPQTTSTWGKTFVTYSLDDYTENYVVYNSNGSGYDQNFCVQGRGQVYCLGVTEF